MKRINQLVLLLLFAGLMSLASALGAQTVEVFTTGLTLPNKVIAAGDHSLLVAEAGTTTPNSGRISMVNRNTGKRKTLISGLPSGVNNLGGPPLSSGPSGLALQGRTLYVTISVGDAVQNVGPGLESSNPKPSSRLFCSVLRLTLPREYENSSGLFTLSFENQESLENGGTVVLTNAVGEEMSLRMVINLPNYKAEPRPTAPNNVRTSNLYGVEFFQKQLYVVDASFNLIYRMNTDGSGRRTFVKFASKPNPLFPTLGGPEVEAVPDNIHRVGNRLLVPLLTGFPFVENLAEIRSVNLTGGRQVVLIPNLTSAIDVLHTGTDDQFFTLEFSAKQLEGEPGRLRFYSSPDADPVTLVSNLISPTSMIRDKKTGAIFITNIFPGLITRVTDLP